MVLVCFFLCSCGKKKPGVLSHTVPQNDSLMALFNAPVAKQTASDTSAQIVAAKPVQHVSVKSTPVKSDTAATLDAAIKNGASTISVALGSSEDRRLDSLMIIANTLSERYRALVATHTHQNLAQAAHQDPAKTRRLLNTISAKSAQRIENAKLISEERKKRLQELSGQ
jgi:hypothetical protein